MKEVKQKKDAWSKALHDRIRSEASESQAKIIDLASEKGASSWLTSLPLAKYGFALNKQMFQDGICLRYNFALKLVARTCVCGELYTVNHCMTCKKGGYVILRHNSLRDLFAEILEEVCSDVQIEPPLLPLTGEKLPHGSNTAPGARLDVSARNLWSPLAKAFIDVRIFNPQAKTNWDRSIPQMYTSHENEKKTEYLPRVLQVEKATFTPAVFSTSGGIGKEADKLIRRMAERMSAKRGETYSSVVSFLRRRFRFDLLKTCIIFIMGDTNLPNVNWELERTAAGCSKNDRECFEILEKVMLEHFLIQCVDRPTRKDNLLDVVMTNNEDMIRRIQTEETVMSDHNFVICNLAMSASFANDSDYVRKGFNALNLHKADWETINEELEAVDWSAVSTTSECEDLSPDKEVKDAEDAINFRLFSKRVLETCSKHAPVRSNKRTKNKCDYRAQLRKRKRRRLKLQRLQDSNPGSPEVDKVKGELVEGELEMRDMIQGKLKDDEREIIDQIKVNPKAFYAYANSFQKTKQRIGPLEEQNTKELTSDPTKMANILQNQYVKAFSNPNTPIPEDVKNKVPVSCSITDINFTAEDIERAIDQLQIYSATGPDDFPAIVLKKCKTQLSIPLYC